MMKKFLSILFVLAVTLSALPSLAEGTDSPRKIVDDNQALLKEAILHSTSDEDMRTKARAILEKFVDFEEFGRLRLDKQWDTLNQAQRTSYLAEFKELLQRTYLRRFKAGKEFKLEYRGDTRLNKTGDRAEVPTTVTTEDVGVDVDYRFYQKDGGWKVYDIIVDDVSIMRNYRKSFLKVMSKDGFDALLAKMRSKTSEEED